jgi:hypothetical protein
MTAVPWRTGRACVLLAIALAGCAPQLARHPETDVLPAAGLEPADDARIVADPRYQVLRGAAPGETAGSESLRKRAIANALLTDYYRNRESRVYRSQADGSRDYPNLCLALSGGGMRALAFSTGVISALHARGVYQKTDVVSAASGGAFASYWILSNVSSGATEDEILSGPASAHLTGLRERANGLLAPIAKAGMVGGIVGDADPIFWALDPVGTSLTKVFETMTPGPMIDQTEVNRSYGAALHRMVTGQSPRRAKLLPFAEYRDLVEEGRVPLPVWLTTARQSSERRCVGSTQVIEAQERARGLPWAAFEASPLRIGSEQLGFLPPGELAATAALAASGAGTNIPYSDRCVDFAFLDASVRMRNYPVPEIAAEAGRKSPRHQPDFDLIDGGLADNLATFPLVRRLCSEIVIVDAEHDPNQVFAAFGYLQQHLAELDIPFSVPELEAVAARNRLPSPFGTEASSCSGRFCLVLPKPECTQGDEAAGCMPPDRASNSIYDGTIGPIPIATRTEGDGGNGRWAIGERMLRVRYLKMSLDAARIDAYPATVRNRYADQVGRRSAGACSTTQDTGGCRFPEESTADLDYREGQFEAYWDLGRCTVERYWDGGGAPFDKRCGDTAWPAVSIRP